MENKEKSSESVTAKPKKAKAAINAADLKKKIGALRLKKVDAIQQKDRKAVDILRKRINRLKKRTRKAA